MSGQEKKPAYALNRTYAKQAEDAIQRAERAERELAEERRAVRDALYRVAPNYAQGDGARENADLLAGLAAASEYERDGFKQDLAAALERERECEEAIRFAHQEAFYAGVEFEDERIRWKSVQVDRGFFDEWPKMPAVVRALGREWRNG